MVERQPASNSVDSTGVGRRGPIENYLENNEVSYWNCRSWLGPVSVGRILTSVPHRIPRRRTVPCEAGQHWKWEGVSFTVLHPEAGATGYDNERSCVLRVSTGARAVLIPGDIEHGAEARLVRRLGPALHAEVLVAPHHGSKTSSTPGFVAAVSPRYVVFSAGYRNRWPV